MEPVNQIRIFHNAGFISLVIVLVGKQDLVVLELDFIDVFIVDHRHEGAVIDLLDLLLGKIRSGHFIEQEHDRQNQNIIKRQRFFRRFYFFHSYSPLLSDPKAMDKFD